MIAVVMRSIARMKIDTAEQDALGSRLGCNVECLIGRVSACADRAGSRIVAVVPRDSQHQDGREWVVTASDPQAWELEGALSVMPPPLDIGAVEHVCPRRRCRHNSIWSVRVDPGGVNGDCRDRRIADHLTD